jgi:hypothetical protein
LDKLVVGRRFKVEMALEGMEKKARLSLWELWLLLVDEMGGPIDCYKLIPRRCTSVIIGVVWFEQSAARYGR